MLRKKKTNGRLVALLLCAAAMLGAFAGCKQTPAEPEQTTTFLITATPKLSKTIHMADGSTRQMADDPEMYEPNDEISTSLVIVDPIKFMRSSSHIVEVEIEGIVMDGADVEIGYVSLMKATVVESHNGDLEAGDVIYFTVGGNSKRVSGVPISAYEKGDRYLLFLRKDSTLGAYPELGEEVGMDRYRCNFIHIASSFQIFEAEGQFVAAKRTFVYPEDGYDIDAALTKRYKAGMKSETEQRALNMLEENRAEFEIKSDYVVVTYDEMRAFLENEVLPYLSDSNFIGE